MTPEVIRAELLSELDRLVAEQQELLEARHRSILGLSRNLKAQERVRNHLTTLDRGEEASA
jgi:hypothetical protein